MGEQPRLNIGKDVDDVSINVFVRAIMARPEELMDAIMTANGALEALEKNMASLFRDTHDINTALEEMPRSRLMESIDGEFKKAMKYGGYAGHVFLATTALCRSGLPVSQNRAVHLVKNLTGEKEQTLKNAWNEYKDVAHYWAAFVVRDRSHNNVANDYLMGRTKVNYGNHLADYATLKKLFKGNKNTWRPCCISTGDHLKKQSLDLPKLTEYARNITLNYTSYE